MPSAIAKLWEAWGLSRRFRALAPREQLLAVLSLVVVCSVAAYGVATWVVEFRQAAVARLAAQQTDLQWMRANRARAAAPSRHSDRAAGAQGRLSVINAAAKDFDVSLRRLQPDANGFTVQVENVPFATLIRWSHALEVRHGIEIASVSIDVAEPGVVNGRFNVR